MSEPLGMSVENDCYECMIIDRDAGQNLPVGKCLSCEEMAEARADDNAWNLREENRLREGKCLTYDTSDEPSGHDWTEREGEYRLPIVFLQDGGVYEELWELDDMRQRAREIECKWCHLLTPKQFNDCQACDKPLELNVR